MKFWLTLVLLLLAALPVRADELRVTINMPAGQIPLDFTLEGPDVGSFWQRWNRLPLSDRMVPLPDGQGYAGLLLRTPDDDHQIRLYNGIGYDGEQSRSDELRVLERWVLGKAPPPLGPALVAALDQDVQQQADAAGTTPPPKPVTSMQLITDCRLRARHNHRLRILCLEETLKEQADPKAYADALEQAATQLLPATRQ